MSPDPARDPLANALGADAGHVVMERGYSLGFVGVQGQARLIQFRASKKGFSGDRAADDAAFAGFLDDFCANVARMLRERWGEMALRVAFDGEGEVIARLVEEGPSVRCDGVDPAEGVDAKALLVKAAAKPIENWGLFEMGRALDDGGFAHERRCQELVAGVKA